MSTTLQPDARRAQLDAIDASGVAEPLHLFQPRNPVFWVLAWGIAVGILHTFQYYRPGLESYGGALAGGTLAFALYLVPWLLFLHWLDRYTPVRTGLLVTGALWGGFAATLLLALTVNSALLDLYGKWFGTTWASDWAAGFTAPITEEMSKAIGFVLLLGLAPRLIRSAYDALIIGAFIGIGFEVTEDVLYVFNAGSDHFGTNQAADAVKVIVLRSASGLTSHAMFSAMVCSGLFWILGRDPRGRHVGKGLLLIVGAMVLHGSWDVSGVLGTTIGGLALGAAMAPILLVVGITVILLVSRDAGLTERRWARAILEPEVERGSLSDDEVAAISGTHRDRRHFVKAAHGHHDHHVAKHVLVAGRELLAAIGRAGGEETDEVTAARAELERIRGERRAA